VTDTKICYHFRAVEQAVVGKIVVQVLGGTERGRGVGRPEHGRDKLQMTCRGEMEKEEDE
jgi:hypothetical protein